MYGRVVAHAEYHLTNNPPTPMNANCKGALAQINKSSKKMSKVEVKAVLEYAVNKGYEHTGMLSDEEVDNIFETIKKGTNGK